MIHIRVFPSPLGPAGLAWRDGRVCALELPGASEQEVGLRLRARASGLGPVTDGGPEGAEELVRRIQRHLDGQPDRFADVPIDLDGLSPFTQRVAEEARRLAPGETITYGGLAARCGRPGGARAVGRVMSRNRIPLLVPCHRVLGSDGELRGFSAEGGVRTKLRLLTVEGADLGALSRAGPARLRRTDPLLGRVIRRVGGYGLTGEVSGDPFTALAKSIVHQQVSMAAGRSIFASLSQVLGGEVTPERVAGTAEGELRGAGLSRQKASYLGDLARRAVDGSLPLERLSRMDDERVIEVLTAVRGLGRWSAEMFLIFHLRRLDVLPVGDLGLRKGLRDLYSLPDLPQPAEARELGAKWSPYRTVATWYLWRWLDGVAML